MNLPKLKKAKKTAAPRPVQPVGSSLAPTLPPSGENGRPLPFLPGTPPPRSLHPEEGDFREYYRLR